MRPPVVPSLGDTQNGGGASSSLGQPPPPGISYESLFVMQSSSCVQYLYNTWDSFSAQNVDDPFFQQAGEMVLASLSTDASHTRKGLPFASAY